MTLRRFALAIAFGLTMAASAQVMAQSVLYVARPAIALSVSDRTASRQPPVEFTVTMPGGKTTTATAAPQVGGERAGTVHYPSDFGNAGMHVGDYSWTARIAGKVVMRGNFSYRPSKDGQLLFVPS
ncbi:hypothetical protein DFR41_106118 [Pseudacidovorax intermedius]|uniref:Uncharacterized protein n=1 Tax=Pseudacidovorax intermedius TaxID=433924 RepID=A0A370FDU0_9BURK|nr:hypothetical protein [Pseudacidovorax intermedius]RDI23413.1 hypothetical protein DFR41_106118 [Pseudacidovorax intermedius]